MGNRDKTAFHGRSVLVTGGTGSFGKRFIKNVLEEYNPERLIVFSRDELKQHDMASEFPTEKHPCIRYFLGDVRDLQRLTMAFRGIDTVVHAAALKQVPAAEYNPFECIRTNVIGAENIVNAALQTDVKNVLALSTDKAVNPTNLYGASKLAADKIFVAANNLSGQDGTRFSVVRYGNVIGSRGSVVELYNRLVAKGVKKLPVTDPRMTRFWISLDQGVEFVLSSLSRMSGGEIFVPKIPSMSVSTLASCIAPDLEQETIGIRPGEKLHEALITEDDARYTVELKDSYVIEPAFNWWEANGHLVKEGRRVTEDFRYASDNNTEWLDAAGMRQLIENS
ncbi:MAG: UDP-N-acetylglucosamine 4,6-dehydratase (inverting) [Alphaproteobacteria bacterium MarineAlpha11_Bin1]|nr:MAG: UDP-N-acetylglucosamine 4,6-dehydratase (inverting) [Alphaproteobacteria bacterium MarineAlpha11_Bin1]|tara:strand:- start:4017 stop:5027 length:1011 start_codon:yes stop_codon:yes gene_type:complete